MINFIICEDNEYVRKLHEVIISRVTMPYDFNYAVHSFERYNVKLKNLINSVGERKVYILDLELPNKSGIDITREIRKSDWESIIIILTSHDEKEMILLKQKLLIFDFISKFDDYEKRLTDTLNMIIKKSATNNSLSFKSNNELNNVKIRDILYICKDYESNKVKIVTTNKEYLVRDSLANISKKLNSRFYQSHRCCYVNLDNVKKVDFKNSTIYFINDKTTDYLSRNYKKDLRKIL